MKKNKIIDIQETEACPGDELMKTYRKNPEELREILEKAPEKAEILLEMGMHCLGCPASQMETLEEACSVHGIDVEEIVKKLNA